ncbi:hypothetical protein JCM19037_2860 [Geomicrobium sp. JCM 19037]|nr:hypothetical protein JCM19037_2860 [Geomicrobium sp. JCM 19037]
MNIKKIDGLVEDMSQYKRMAGAILIPKTTCRLSLLTSFLMSIPQATATRTIIVKIK